MMNGLEIFILIECIVGIILVMVLIAMVVFLRRRKLKKIEVEKKESEVKPVLYDPYGLYAPVSEEELALIDAKAKSRADRLLRWSRDCAK